MSIVSAAGKLSPDTSIPGRDQGHAVVVHVVRPNPLDPRPLSPKTNIRNPQTLVSNCFTQKTPKSMDWCGPEPQHQQNPSSLFSRNKLPRNPRPRRYKSKATEPQKPQDF